MPKIPTYLAEGSPAVTRLPEVPRVADIPVIKNAGAAMVAHGLGNVSEAATQVVDVARAIKRQKDENELIRQQYSYDPDIETLKKEILLDPTIEDPFTEFSERAGKLQSTYLDSIKEPEVKVAFQRHIDKTFPEIQKEMGFDVLKIQNQKNVAGLHEISDTLSTAAATGTPEVRDKAIADYNHAVEIARLLGTINPIEAVDMKRKFRTNLMTKNMTALAVNDPYKLFELQRQGAYANVDAVVQERLLYQARSRIEANDKRNDERFKVAQKANEEHYLTQAMNGAIGDPELQMMIEGNHPYVTDPHLIKTIAAWNADPVSVSDSKPVETIMLNYSAMSKRNPEEIFRATERTRAELDAYRLNLTKRDPSLKKAYDALNRDEIQMAGQVRAQGAAERGEEAAARARRQEPWTEESHQMTRQSHARAQEHEVERKIAKDTQTAIDIYKATSVPKPGFLKGVASRQRAEQIADEAEIRLLMKPGTLKPQEAVDIVNKKRKEKKGTGSTTDPVLELVPKR